jgi:co-chaperonin GroES (HSP10)
MDIDMNKVRAPFPYEACGRFVIVTRIKETSTKSGLLYVPEAAATDENRAVVVKVGPKVEDKLIVPDCEVIIEKYDGRKVVVEDVEYIALPEDEILAVRSA